MRLNRLFSRKRDALLRVCASVLLLLGAQPLFAFNAVLQGQTDGSSSWTTTDPLDGYEELNHVPCRVYFTDGPASNQVIVLQFDHTDGVIPCIQDLSGFTNSANVTITSGPTLSAPPGQDVWSYRFTVDVTNSSDGFVKFKARLSSGCHLSSRSSQRIQGSDSLGTLKITTPAIGDGVPDLVVYKNGPAIAAPGDIITYTLNYFNKTNAPKGADRSQLSDILPPEVTYVPDSATAGGTLVGNMLTWDLPDHLDEGQTGSVTYQVQISTNLVFGQTFSNLAQIYSSENDLDYSDNSSSVITTMIFDRPPVVTDDSYTIDENGSLTVDAPGILGNDSDPDGDTMTAMLVASVNHGTLQLNPDGSFVYTPATNFFGTDAFAYQANDGISNSAPAMVTITVRRVNVPPTVRILSPTNGTIYFAPANIAIIAEALDSDGSVTSIEFFADTNALPQTNLTASYVVWTNVASGGYQLTAKATDSDGATALSSPVSIIVLERPPSFTLQPVHFNPQSGLFEEIVRVSNPSTKALDGVRVLITGLRTNAAVFNASGKTTNDVPYVQTQVPLPAGGTVDLTIEYYVPDFKTPNPTLTMEIVPSAEPKAVPTGTYVPVTRRVRSADGSFLVEFDSLSNRIYFIQYSDNTVSWKTAWPSIMGTGSHLQWMDNGPPRTDSFPGAAVSRFYRVLLAP